MHAISWDCRAPARQRVLRLPRNRRHRRPSRCGATRRSTRGCCKTAVTAGGVWCSFVATTRTRFSTCSPRAARATSAPFAGVSGRARESSNSIWGLSDSQSRGTPSNPCLTFDREFFFAATLPPHEWHTIRQRLRRRAKSGRRPLLYAAVETHDLGGEPVVYVVARERLRKAGDDIPVQPGAATRVWSESVRHAASTAVRNPVSFSKAWPLSEDETPDSHFDRLCSVNASEADVEAIARARGFPLSRGRWGDRNVLPMRATFNVDRGRYQSDVERFYAECEIQGECRERLEAHANLPDE